MLNMVPNWSVYSCVSSGVTYINHLIGIFMNVNENLKKKKNMKIIEKKKNIRDFLMKSVISKLLCILGQIQD